MFNQHVVFYVLLSSMCEGGVTWGGGEGKYFPSLGQVTFETEKGRSLFIAYKQLST